MRRTLGSILLAAVVFVVAGEVLARMLHVVDRLNGYSRLLYAPGPSLDLPYVLRPNVETTLLGIPVRTNALGFRGDAVEPVRAPGVRRVAVVGDSVVFGQTVAEDDTVSAALARRLAAAGGRWEVINAGVPGYDAVSEARLLERTVLPLRPEAVVVGTSLNDYDPTPVYSPTGVLVRKDLDARAPGLADRSEFLMLLRWACAYARGELFSQVAARVGAQGEQARADGTATATAANVGRYLRDVHLGFYHAPVAQYWDRLRAAYADVGRLAAAHGVRALVAVFPEEYQVTTDAPDTAPQQALLRACADAHLECLDLLPAFRAAGGDLFADTQHPNARGLAVAADAIAAALRHS
jgi:lysophospholipase L1-like esterase